ncbi:MAG: PAS domain S-box protein [Oscillatoria sp. PMC 1068.18]|nr:PAS domain S-box protein [Oscillatoria sp. PMC 1076.18]MEC4988918.1 PAS domain S-box protein [Oscillatoria sp. PMC 1068.18]
MLVENLRFSSPSLEEICDRSPLTVTPDTSLEIVLARMDQTIGSQCLVEPENAKSSLVLSNYALVIEADKIVGIFTARDLVHLAATEKQLTQVPISEVMTKQPFTLRKCEERDIFQVLAIFRENRLRHLPVIDEQENVFGVITQNQLYESIQSTSLLKLRTVAEVIDNQVISAPARTSLLDIAQLMTLHQVSYVVIFEAQQQETFPTKSPPNSPISNSQSLKPMGIITEQDLAQSKILGLNLANLPASAIATAPLFSVNPTDSLAIASEQMQRQHRQQLIVTNPEGKLQGIVTQSSFLRLLEPTNLYDLVAVLQQKISHLETENLQLLQQQNPNLEPQPPQQITALQKQAQKSCFLADISQQIHQSLDLNHILNVSVTETRKFFAADRVIIYRFYQNWSGVVVAESLAEGIESLMGRVIYDPCFAPNFASLKKGGFQVINDIYNVGITPCHLQLLEQLQIRAKLLVPLIIGEQLWGLISINECNAPRQWEPEEIELIEKLATQVAIAIKQTISFERLQSEIEAHSLAESKLRISLQRQKAIAQISQKALSETNLDVFFDETLKIVAQTLAVTHSQVLELLPNQAALSLKAGIGWEQKWLGQTVMGVSPRTQIGYTLQQAQPIVVEDLLIENRFGGSAFLHNHKIISGITTIIPQKNNQIYGILGIHTTTPRNFTLEEVNFLQKTANIVASTIERQQLILQYQQAEKELNHFFNFSLDLLCIAGTDGYFKRLNPTFETVLGYTKTELLTNKFFFFIHPDDIDATLAEINKLSAGIPTIHFENRYRTKKGEYRWFAWTSRPTPDGKLYCVAHDITQRKQAEAELKKLNEELETRVEENTLELIKTVANLMQEIREHRHTEERLRESEERFRNIVETTSDYIWEIDSYGNFTYISPRINNLLGYEPHKLIGTNFFNLMLSQEAERVKKIFNPLVQAKKTIHSLEHTLIHHEGHLIFVETSGTPIINTQGEYKGYRGVEKDITERKQAEAERQKLAALVENSNEFIIMTNVTGEVTYLNRSGRQLIGLTKSTVLETKSIFDFASPEDLTNIKNQVLPKLRQGKANTGEITLRHLKTGKEIPSIYNIFPIKNQKSKHILAFGGIFHNLSERKKFELALQESKQEIFDILESITEGYLALDKQWRFITVNSYLEPIFQLPATELIGKNIWSVFPELIDTSFDRAYHQAFQEQITVAFEDYYPFLNIWFEVRVYPYKDGISVYFRDISDRKRAEEKIKASLHEKELLLKETHHRVKNNLLVVSSLLEWQVDYLQNPEIVKIFEDSQNRIQTMALIHEKLYRSDNLAEIDFGDYLETLVNHIFSSCNLDSQLINLNLDLQPLNLNIESANPCGLIVNELIANIVKHAFPNNKKGEVTIKLHQHEQEKIILIVQDNGVGFPENVDWENTESLGLQLVCILTEQLEGKLELDRSQGTKFKLTFSELNYQRRL